MSFLTKLGGGKEAAPTPPQSPPASKQQGGKEGESAQGNSAIRLKPYSGLEIKTLWNHFNKEDLMTVQEIGELLDRVLVKDATDIFTALKASKAWREYCSQGLKSMDASRGGSLDLQEFNAEFNKFYVSRAFFVIKYILPALNKELRKICLEAGLDASRIAEVDAILVGEVPPPQAPAPVVVNDGEIRKLKETVDNLTRMLEQHKQDLASSSAEARQLKDDLSRVNSDYQRLLSQYEEEKAGLTRAEQDLARSKLEADKLRSSEKDSENFRREIDRLQQQLDTAQEATLRADSESRQTESRLNSRISTLESENASIKSRMDEKDREVAKWKEAAATAEKETQRLKKNQTEEVNEWKKKFDDIIKENDQCRQVMNDLRAEIVRVNSTLLEAQLADKEKSNPTKISAFHAASISGVSLDPLRTELVNQFGSIEAVIGKRRKITLHELESVAVAIGYTREYCRKLFYALDVKNRGFLSVEQFSRPLPTLNHELCLLTQATN